MFEAKKESEKRTTQFLDRGPNSSLSKSRYARKKFPNIKAKDSSAIRSSSGGKSPNFLPGNHPMLDRSAAPASYSKSHMNLDLMKRPLKERIIHLLAVRPFKKPELILRINRGKEEKPKGWRLSCPLKAHGYRTCDTAQVKRDRSLSSAPQTASTKRTRRTSPLF